MIVEKKQTIIIYFQFMWKNMAFMGCYIAFIVWIGVV